MHRKSRRMYDAVCSKCGVQTQVPFKPVPGKEVYCRDCFKEVAESAPAETPDTETVA